MVSALIPFCCVIETDERRKWLNRIIESFFAPPRRIINCSIGLIVNWARYLSFDAGQALLLSAHKVYVVELSQIGSLVGAPICSNNWNLPETVCGFESESGRWVGVRDNMRFYDMWAGRMRDQYHDTWHMRLKLAGWVLASNCACPTIRRDKFNLMSTTKSKQQQQQQQIVNLGSPIPRKRIETSAGINLSSPSRVCSLSRFDSKHQCTETRVLTHVQLSYEARHVAVLEVKRQQISGKLYLI